MSTQSLYSKYFFNSGFIRCYGFTHEFYGRYTVNSNLLNSTHILRIIDNNFYITIVIGRLYFLE